MARKNKKQEKDAVTFLVTIPKELEERIQKEATKERRSRHAQVICALEERYAVANKSLALQA